MQPLHHAREAVSLALEPQRAGTLANVSRRERIGRFPASGAVFASVGANALAAGTLHAREEVLAVLQLLFLVAFLVYCAVRPRGGAALALPVVVGNVLIALLVAVERPRLALLLALVASVYLFVVAARLDEEDEQIAIGRRGRR